MGRKIEARVLPNSVAKDLAAVATALTAAAGVDTGTVNPGPTQRSTLLAHVYVISDPVATAAAAKVSMDAAFTAQGVAPFAYSPLVESNDADDAVTISRAAGATVIRFTATDVDQNPDNSLTFALNQGGISDAAFTTPRFTPISDGVVDLSIDLQPADAAGPYTVTVTVTDVQGLVGTVTTVVTSIA